ncbi:hypothetical protein P5G51_018805 [Virgibacillus sp. 179-BFC.A HS]|uniref:Uncharacterized protein n=1 Tax=Tigheibacillus jepli TaxID=3035914 RepID=A0ABU5CMJ2_9BACI|nr:hypothetical protein [Virgibacillus sp. 179-BFC.A HS]MDY0407111.1 hypothetical protein [Virgibacillus sp. 179-BFC.A HS]
MIGLVTAIVLFNLVAFVTNKRLTTNQIVHIWTFTIALLIVTETYLIFKYHGYWYFYKEINWGVLPAQTVVVPPVNMIFLNWYPFGQQFYKRVLYIAIWTLAIVCYEAITLLPEPWGYFNHGWWKLWYSAIVDPFLLMSVLFYYKWICRIEKSTHR